MSVWVLLEGAGKVGEVSLIVGIIAAVLSTVFALALAFKRVAPTDRKSVV